MLEVNLYVTVTVPTVTGHTETYKLDVASNDSKFSVFMRLTQTEIKHKST